LALTWLLHFGKTASVPRWPFEDSGGGLACERENDRPGTANAAANAIYLALGVKCDRE